jgi:hypothetical protein
MDRRGFLGRLFGAVAGASVAGKVVAEPKLEAVQKPFAMGVTFRPGENVPMGYAIIKRARALAESLKCFYRTNLYRTRMGRFEPDLQPVYPEQVSVVLVTSTNSSWRRYDIEADSDKNMLSCICTEPNGAWNMPGTFSLESWEKIEKAIRRVEGA